MDQPNPQVITTGQPVQMLLDPNLSQWILSPYDILDSLKHTLRGEILVIEEDPKRGRVEYWRQQKTVKPLLNEEGINYIYNQLLTFVNRNTTLSFVDEDEVNKLGLQTCNDIAEAIGKNCKFYDLDPSMYASVNRIIVNFIYLALKRAWKGGERDFFGKTTSRSETVVQNPQEKKGWFPFPFGGR